MPLEQKRLDELVALTEDFYGIYIARSLTKQEHIEEMEQMFEIDFTGEEKNFIRSLFITQLVLEYF